MAIVHARVDERLIHGQVAMVSVSYTHLDVYKRQLNKEELYMATRIPCTPFGKKMKIAMVEQDIPQQELAKRLGLSLIHI